MVPPNAGKRKRKTPNLNMIIEKELKNLNASFGDARGVSRE